MYRPRTIAAAEAVEGGGGGGETEALRFAEGPSAISEGVNVGWFGEGVAAGEVLTCGDDFRVEGSYSLDRAPAA
jgi:hypothetical protein